MKKTITLFVIALLALIGISANAQTNLIAGYDANKKTGTNSEENKWGWTCPTNTSAWGTANSSGVRYQDPSSGFYKSDGTTLYVGRTTMLRFDTPASGNVWSLGTDNGDATPSQTAIPLTGGVNYTLSGQVCYNKTGAASFTISVYYVEGAVELSSQVINIVSTTKAQVMQNFTMPIAPVTTGTYLLKFTQTSGTAGILYIGDGMSLVNPLETYLTCSKTNAFFDNSTDGLTETFDVSGSSLTSDVTISAPSGITLSAAGVTSGNPITIPASGALAATTVTATYDYLADITSGSITIASTGATSKTISISAVKNNLIGSSDADGALGATSQENFWGWAVNSATTPLWGQANGTDVRYQDALAGVTNPDGTAFTGRTSMVRFDTNYGTTAVWSLGLGDGTGTSTTVTAIPLTGCTTYALSGLLAWNSATTTNLTFKVSDAPTGGNVIVTQVVATTATANKLLPFTTSFTCPSTGGSYYLQITGAASGVAYLANLSLKAQDAPPASMIVSKEGTYFYFDNSTGNTSKTFDVSGINLASDITFSAPAGITFVPASITRNSCGGVSNTTVTATFDNSSNISNGTITITSGSLTKSLTVDAVKDNLIGTWDADGSVDATASIPTAVGWSATVAPTWVASNVSTTGAVYYKDAAGYTFNGLSFPNRILFSRWDGSITTASIYSLPVVLTAGRQYKFNGKAFWNSNASAPVITFGINSSADNTGTSLGATTVTTGASYALQAGTFTFNVATGGTYYLTVASTTASIAPLADLSVTDNGSADPTSINKQYSMLPVSQVGSIITVNLGGLSGNQTVTVFDVQGRNLFSATATGGNTVTINKSLNNGMYLVKVQGAEKTFITKLMIR